jgi:hypothetical protein
MGHAQKRSVERAGFTTEKDARESLKEFGKNIERNGFPVGTIRDSARSDRVIVPGFGKGGAVVYQIEKNGNAVLKTVLNWIEP